MGPCKAREAASWLRQDKLAGALPRPGTERTKNDAAETRCRNEHDSDESVQLQDGGSNDE